MSLDRRVSNAALANAALVLSSKNWKKLQDGGQRRKTNPKNLGHSAAVREIDAALVRVQFVLRGCTHH